MPKLEPWASGGRIIRDTEHNLAFIRDGQRRSEWHVYAVSYVGRERTETLTSLGRSGYRSLSKCREKALEAIGEAIGEHAMSLHPLAPYRHLYRGDVSQGASLHACGLSYARFDTAQKLTEVNCPVCLATIAEDIRMTAIQVGVDKVEAGREVVRTTRAANALARLVSDDRATEHEL